MATWVIVVVQCNAQSTSYLDRTLTPSNVHVVYGCPQASNLAVHLWIISPQRHPLFGKGTGLTKNSIKRYISWTRTCCHCKNKMQKRRSSETSSIELLGKILLACYSKKYDSSRNAPFIEKKNAPYFSLN